MSIQDQEREKTREELIREIHERQRPRSFDDMLGPEPEPGDDEDLEDFLQYLREVRQEVFAPPLEDSL
jgi:hypothetical protein